MASAHDYSRLYPPARTPVDETCRCADSSPLKLMSSAVGFNPIHCVRCNLEVPPETLGLDSTLIDQLADWHSAHSAIDRLWLDSKDYESWASDELSRITSPINQRGLDLCTKLNLIRPVYYQLFQDQTKWESVAPLRSCPICLVPLVMVEGSHIDQIACAKCRLIAFAP